MKTTNQHLICEAIGLTDLEYSEMVFDYAYLWFDRYFFGNEIMVEALKAAPSFWKWWKTQWELRDERFVYEANLKIIEMPFEGDLKQIATELYINTHNVYQLIIFPNAIVRLEAGREILKQHITTRSIKKS